MYRKYKLVTFIALLLTGTILFSSCNSLFRDVPNDKLSQESIWPNKLLLDEYVLPWYRNMNNGFSIFLPTNALIKGAARDFLPWYGDQMTVSKADLYNTAYGDILKANAFEITRRARMDWGKYYTRIQAINLLLENQAKIQEGTHKNRVLGEAHFFRAYYYCLLLRRFGGVMLIKQNYDPLRDGKKFPRASYEEMVDFITAEADLAHDFLAKAGTLGKGRVTPGASLMLKAKTYFWASSSIFMNQPADKPYLGFPDNRSDALLAQAKAAYDELFTLPYSLVPVDGTTQDEIMKSYRKIFLTKNSSESILEVQHSDDGNFSDGFGHKLDRESVSPFFGGTTALYTPTQNHVDEYGMRNGAVADPAHPYENRDYRFYANILYDGCTYRGHEMEIHTTIVNGEEVKGADLTPHGSSTSAAVTKTGYYLGKFVDATQEINTNDTYGSKQNFIIWRLAEAILDYAEIEFRLGHPDKARLKVNDIRARAHMQGLPAPLTWEALVNERRVEMAFEETTYWDMIRWGVDVAKMNGILRDSPYGKGTPLMKMEITKEDGKPTIYKIDKMNRKPARVRRYDIKQRYYPIPWDEVRYHKIAQNPDWDEV